MSVLYREQVLAQAANLLHRGYRPDQAFWALLLLINLRFRKDLDNRRLKTFFEEEEQKTYQLTPDDFECIETLIREITNLIPKVHLSEYTTRKS